MCAWLMLGRMSETQPPLLLKKYRITPPMCIAIHLQSVLQCFRCPYSLRKGKHWQHSSHYIEVHLRVVLQYASHLYRSAWWLWSPGCSPYVPGGAQSGCCDKHDYDVCGHCSGNSFVPNVGARVIPGPTWTEELTLSKGQKKYYEEGEVESDLLDQSHIVAANDESRQATFPKDYHRQNLAQPHVPRS